jgi:hypothetical protein
MNRRSAPRHEGASASPKKKADYATFAYRPAAAPGYKPAAALSAAALSVTSQVNSGSSRPKWP